MAASPRTLPRLVDAEIDWLSASLPAGDPDYRAVLLASRNILKFEQKRGHDINPLRISDYTGQQTKHFGVAENQNGLILRCSGPTARKHAADMVFLAGGLRASRCDLQCTTREERLRPFHARQVFNRVCQLSEQGHRVGKLARSLHESRDAGWTLYLGAPKSRKRLRHYNKTAEMKQSGPPWLERWELQLRDEDAQTAMRRWSQSSDRPQYAAGRVRGYMSRYGIDEEWQEAPKSEWDACERNDTDDEALLKWIAQQVRPTAHRLAGKEKGVELFQALNFSPEFLEQIAAELRAQTTKLKIDEKQ